MAENGADFTATFRALTEACANESRDAEVRTLFADPAAYDHWSKSWRERIFLGTAVDNRTTGADAQRESDVHSPKPPR